MLGTVGDVALGVDQKPAWQPDDTLIRAATRRGRQLGNGRIRDVDADHGKITVFELPDIRAAPAADALSAMLMRVGADALGENHTHNA